MCTGWPSANHTVWIPKCGLATAFTGERSGPLAVRGFGMLDGSQLKLMHQLPASLAVTDWKGLGY